MHHSVFKIEEAQSQVGKIKFTGNHAFNDRKLIPPAHESYSIPLYFRDIAVLSKTYDREKLARISKRVRGFTGQWLLQATVVIRLDNIDTRNIAWCSLSGRIRQAVTSPSHRRRRALPQGTSNRELPSGKACP